MCRFLLSLFSSHQHSSGGRTISAAQAAQHEKQLSPQLSSSSPRITGVWLSGGTSGNWGAPRVHHSMGQLRGNCSGQVRTSQLPRKRQSYFKVMSSLELVWQRCFFLNYTVMHMQLGHRRNCCLETLTLAFS